MNSAEHANALKELKSRIWSICKGSMVNAQVAADKAKTNLPITSISQAEAILRVLTPRKKKPKEIIHPEIKQRYRDAKYTYEQREFPTWIKDGHFIEPEFPDTSTANGIQNLIIDYLTWTGHFANRTSNEGRVIIKEGQPKRIPSSGKNGMQDVDCNLKHPDHEFGIPWKIEVKAPGDTHKDHQKDYGKLVTKTGGVYSVVRGAVDFFEQFDRLMLVKSKQGVIFE